MDWKKLRQKAESHKRESKYVDFKSHMDVSSSGDWCELVKDVVAMANYGGGVIVFGVQNNGRSADFDPGELLAYDPAKITDKIDKYTGRQFADFSVEAVKRRRKKKAVMLVDAVDFPMVFRRAGTYSRDGKEKVAFREGILYTRHGAKSEPATETDLRAIIERQLEKVREEWLKGIREITAAPPGSVIHIETKEASRSATGPEVRLVRDEAAPPVRLSDETDYPFRQKDVIREVNRKAGQKLVNSHDILSVRRVYDVKKKHPDFMYDPFETAAAQYSEAFVEWLLSKHKEDPEFFQKARTEYYNLMHG